MLHDCCEVKALLKQSHKAEELKVQQKSFSPHDDVPDCIVAEQLRVHRVGFRKEITADVLAILANDCNTIE